MPFQLLFIGSPLLDVTTKCDQQYLKEHNLKPDDCIRATDDHQSLLVELLQDPKSILQAGGSAQNSARVCKWVLGASGSVAFAGCVGNDDFSSRMRQQLIKDNVEPLYTTHPTESTGVCACLISPNGERSMVTSHGAASTYDVFNLSEPDVQAYMNKADVIFVVGYFLAHSPDVFESVARFCDKENRLFSVSLSAPYICRDYGELLMEHMPYIDVVFGNCSEAKELVRKIAPDITREDPKQYSKTIAQIEKRNTEKPRIVIITNGANPLTVCETNGNPQEYPILEVDSFIDTLGCGDALAGGFLASFIKTGSTSESIISGISAAAKIAETHGCTIPAEKFEEMTKSC